MFNGGTNILTTYSEVKDDMEQQRFIPIESACQINSLFRNEMNENEKVLAHQENYWKSTNFFSSNEIVYRENGKFDLYLNVTEIVY